MASRGPGDGYAGGCRRVQGPSESLSVGTCAVLAPCLREARSCLVAAWCRGGCCPRGPAPGDLVLLLLATRAPYSPAVFLAAHHPSGECGPSPSWTPRWVGSRRAEFSLGPTMDFDLAKRTSASAAPDPSASAVPSPPASASSLASANPQAPEPSAAAESPAPADSPASATPLVPVRPPTESRSHREQPPLFCPRVLVLTSDRQQLSSLSPFQRREGCDRLGSVVRCVKLKDGGIEVEFKEEREAQRALAATHFMYTVKSETGRRTVKVPIQVSAHRSKNSGRGVIFCDDLEGVSDDEIADGLSESGVISARRILTRKAGKLVPTHSVVLTFNKVDLPSEVLVGYLRVKVRPYIPNPIRCFRCLRFGHTRDNCRNRPTCAKCAATDHTRDDCSADSERCVNCDSTQRPHSTFDQRCPAFIREKEILTIKTSDRISYREARERYNTKHPKRSYASVAGETRPSHPVDADQRSNISQLISLLQSFGLKVVASPGALGPIVPHKPPATAPASSDATTQTSQPAVREANGSDQDGWTLVQSRRNSRSSQKVTPPVQSPPVPPRPAGTAVREAIRRNEERQAQSRPAGSTRETRRAGAVSAPAPASASGQETPSGAGPSPMGPPPTPPPSLPQRQPPAPTGHAAADSRPPPKTPPSAPRHPEPPSAPGRPTKRPLPWESSPTEGGSSRPRQRPQPGPTGGRSSSADGRRRNHPPIQFGDGSFAGATQFF